MIKTSKISPLPFRRRSNRVRASYAVQTTSNCVTEHNIFLRGFAARLDTGLHRRTSPIPQRTLLLATNSTHLLQGGNK